MRVIKPGINKGEDLYQAICNNCRCEFEFKRLEATEHIDPRDGRYLRIECPTCIKDVFVNVRSYNG